MCSIVHAQPADHAPTVIEAALAFIDSLEAAQREDAVLPFNSEARLDWHYVPRERPGLSMKKMTPEQKEKALALMKAALSPKGFEKTETIRKLDDVLRAMGGGPSRDSELYDVVVFGTPSAGEPWGLRYEGHHISLNWTFALGMVIASTPQFLGADPADVQEGEMKGTRALGAEEDLGRSLAKSLTEEQRPRGILSETAPPEILTGAQREAAIQENLGIAYSELSVDQQGLLLEILREYASTQPEVLAEKCIEEIREAGLDAVKFAWMGGLEKGQGHYYRIQGPTFLVEYDNTQDNANHIHSVWRDFEGDFGRDTLKEHYEAHADPEKPGVHEH